MDKLVPVCSALHDVGIHLAVETSLFGPHSNISLAVDYIDLFYVDMKIIDPARCKELERGNLNLYLENLETLMKSGRPIVIRIPVIGSYTSTPNNRELVHNLLAKYKDRILKIER